MFIESELGEFLELITYGFTNPMPDADEGPWKITAKDVINGRVNLASARRTTLEAFQNDLTDKSRPIVGDVLLTKDGTLGRLAVVKEEGICVNQSVAVLRPNGRITPTFLYYLLSSPSSQRKLIADSDGSVLKHIYITRVPKMVVSVPPLKDQKAISHILGTLDDKIELNQKMNQTLEEIAKAIFKSWFVDFDPVRAKAEDRPTGLPPEISDLFPDDLMDSEIGEIPKGWEIGSLRSVSDARSKSVKPDQMAHFSSYVGLEHLPRGHIFLSDWGDPSQAESNKTVFEKGDILFGKLRPYFEKSVIAPTDGVCSTDIVAIEPKPDSQIFVACVVSQKHFFDFTSQGSTGTRMPRTSWKHMCEFVFTVPPHKLLAQFQNLISPVVERAMLGITESKTLSELRDALLPKLISGELRIPDAEKLLEEAGI